jgi:hypothetical protein
MSVTKANNKRVGVTSKVGKCARCKKSFDKVQRALDGFCRQCDTSSAGTWALSYLTELGFISNDDTVENGYVIGTTHDNFLGVPNGKEIYCVVDKYDRTLFHASIDLEIPNELGSTNEDEDDEGDVFWNKPNITKIDFRMNLGIEIVKK